MRNNKLTGIIYLLFFFGFGVSCNSTLYVAPRQVECSAIDKQKCYLIRRDPGQNWISHDGDIIGLDYEPGFHYRIKVKKEQVKHRTIGTSALKLTLIEVLEKTDATDDIALEDLVGKHWQLQYFKQDRVEIGIEKQQPTLEFDLEGGVKGFGGCNRFSSRFTVSDRTINIGDIAATRMHCDGEMSLETSYFEVLGKELRALFSEGKLILTGDGGNQLVFGYQK